MDRSEMGGNGQGNLSPKNFHLPIFLPDCHLNHALTSDHSFDISKPSATGDSGFVAAKGGELKKAGLCIAILSMIILFRLPASSFASDIDTIAHWIQQLQYTNPSQASYGAIRIHHTPGYVDPYGNAYYRVSPYNAHLAVLGLLDSDVEGSLEVAEKWIAWYLDHLNMNGLPEGIVFDHWYLEDGSGETTAPAGINPYYADFDDVSDSYAALLLGVAYKYYEKGGNVAFLTADGKKEQLEIVANVVLSLQDPDDGLTWGKAAWPVKYLMDNCEVYLGLKSMEILERDVFADRKASNVYRVAAKKVKSGIQNELYNDAVSLYRSAKFENGTYAEADLNEWYPGTTHLVWPHLFEVIDPGGLRAQIQMRALNNSWDGDPNPDWAAGVVDEGGFTWPSIGYAALLAGESARAQEHADLVVTIKLPDFPYPFTVDEAGWLLRILAARRGIPFS